MSKTEEIKLDYPIELEGRKIETLSLRRPKVKDQLAADKGGGSDADKEIRLFANLCEEAPATLEELDSADYRKLQEKYSSFLS